MSEALSHYPIWRCISWTADDGGEASGEIEVCGTCVPKHSWFTSRAAVPDWTQHSKGAEPWQDGDPEYMLHQVTCFVCSHDGEPSKDAYRPHTLAADCWCLSGGARIICRLAREWHISPEYKMDGELIQCGLPARAIASTGCAS